MVYPGEERVNVVLDPGNIACFGNDMSCTATIKEDGVYRVNSFGACADYPRRNVIAEYVTSK